MQLKELFSVPAMGINFLIKLQISAQLMVSILTLAIKKLLYQTSCYAVVLLPPSPKKGVSKA